MKKSLFLLCLFGLSLLSGQTVQQVVDITSPQLHGTARFTGLGGAFTALGNDLSAIGLNPASIGVYRRGEFNASFGLLSSLSNAEFLGRNERNLDGNLLIENLGFVVVGERNANKHRMAFSINYTKNANFYTFSRVRGTSTDFNNPTLADHLFTNASGLTPNQLLQFGLTQEYAAYQTFLIDHSVDNGPIDQRNFNSLVPIDQTYTYNRTGSNGLFNIGLGGDYNNRLQWGAAINIPSSNFISVNRIDERGFAPNDPSFARTHSLEVTERVYATGINANFGLILKAAQWLRLGASYQTPTYYGLRSFYSDYSNTILHSNESFEYTVDTENRTDMITPSILRAGIGLIFGKYGLISVDYETSDPSNTRFTRQIFDADEQLVANQLQRRNTLRVGGELRIRSWFARAGIMQNTSPVRAEFNSDILYRALSFGIGYRNKDFSLDGTLVNAQYDSPIPTYTSNLNRVSQSINSYNLVMTAAFMF